MLFSASKVLFVCKMGAVFAKNVLFFLGKVLFKVLFLPKSTTIPESVMLHKGPRLNRSVLSFPSYYLRTIEFHVWSSSVWCPGQNDSCTYATPLLFSRSSALICKPRDPNNPSVCNLCIQCSDLDNK